MTALAAGVTLGGRYRLSELIAVGGMGEVWRADDDVLGRPVAVKVLKAEYAEDPTFLERFRGEARHTAGLSHPGIASVFDYGEASRGDDAGSATTAYLVMELVAGEPLSRLLAREGRLAPAQALDIIGQAGLALQAAHDAGVIHRDVKPGNLLVRADGVVKVTDFGIARVTNAVPLTEAGMVMGTAYYLSPEQAAGQVLTPSSDVYSLAVVGYECLTGTRPFEGDNPVSVAMAHVRSEPPALPRSLPGPLRALIEESMAREPEQRPASAGEFGRRALALSADIEDEDQATVAVAPVVPPRAALGTQAAGAGAAPTRAVTSPLARPTSGSRQRQVTRPGPPGTPTRRIPAPVGLTPAGPAGPARSPRSAGSAGSARSAGSVRPAGPARRARPPLSRGWVRPAVLLVLSLLAVALLVRACAEGSPKQVAVPDLRGKTAAEARSALTKVGLKVGTEGTSTDTAARLGTVISQSPAPPARIDVGAKVGFVVSSRPAASPSAAPAVVVNRKDLVGRPYDDARSFLLKLGLRVGRKAVGGEGTPNTVADASPTGKLSPGDVVTLSVFTSPTPKPAPTAAPSSGPPGPPKPPKSPEPTKSKGKK